MHIRAITDYDEATGTLYERFSQRKLDLVPVHTREHLALLNERLNIMRHA
jgi:hypothetical protein